MLLTRVLVMVMGLAGSAAQAALLLGDAENGARLHARYCTACHASLFAGDGSGIYTRPDRRVKTVEGLAGQVERCNTNLNTRLDADQMADLVKFLNDNFYKF